MEYLLGDVGLDWAYSELFEKAAPAEAPAAAELGAAFGRLGSHYHAYGLAEPAAACYRNARLLPPEDPRSYYSVARRLEREIPNSLYMNQYDNMSNTRAHYETTPYRERGTQAGRSAPQDG